MIPKPQSINVQKKGIPRIGSADEGCDNYAGACGQADMQHAAISYWIDERQNEKPADDEVTKGKPIGCVTEERKPRISLLQPEIHESDPMSQILHIRVRRRIGYAEKPG